MTKIQLIHKGKALENEVLDNDGAVPF